MTRSHLGMNNTVFVHACKMGIHCTQNVLHLLPFRHINLSRKVWTCFFQS